MPPLTNLDEIRALLETDRAWAVYALGDLAPALFAQTRWWHAPAPARALAMRFHGFETPALFLLGEVEALPALLHEAGTGETIELQVPMATLPAVHAEYRVNPEKFMWRMVLGPDTFPAAPVARASRLGPTDLPALQVLFADGAETGEFPAAFAPYMLANGVYCGVREGTELVAAAGTHLVNVAEGVAAIGNVYTRRDRRGRGLGRLTTAAVAAELLRLRVRTVALNVQQNNTPAVGLYEQLGFVRHCAFVEGIAVPL